VSNQLAAPYLSIMTAPMRTHSSLGLAAWCGFEETTSMASNPANDFSDIVLMQECTGHVADKIPEATAQRRLPSLKVLRERRAAKEAAFRQEAGFTVFADGDCKDAGRHKFSFVTCTAHQGTSATVDAEMEQSQEASCGHQFVWRRMRLVPLIMKQQSNISQKGNLTLTSSLSPSGAAMTPKSSILVGAASLGLRTRSRAASQPPTTMVTRNGRFGHALKQSPSEKTKSEIKEIVPPKAQTAQSQVKGLIPRPPPNPRAPSQAMFPRPHRGQLLMLNTCDKPRSH